jgi:1,4-dihydroxy-2-naphthoate polyprenyltransferase
MIPEFKDISWRYWFLGSRPKTWIASLSPVLVGSVWSWTQKILTLSDGIIFFSALFSALSLQIGTNFINDALDFKKGADTSDRLGPQRMVNEGWVTYEKTLKVAAAFLLVAFIFGLPLVWYGGWPIVLVGLISLFLAYSYTGGPFPLAYLGLGEVFVLLFFGIIPVVTLTYLYTGLFFSLEAFVLGCLTGLQSSSLIFINNLRDVVTDTKAGRKTLALRCGNKGSAFLLGSFLLSPSVVLSLWLFFSQAGFISVLPLVVLPAIIKLYIKILNTKPSRQYNEFLAQAGILQWRWTLLTVGGVIACYQFGISLTF